MASIRYWYPDIPIYFIKDSGPGKFNTDQACKIWNIGVLDHVRKHLGWGFGKLEPLFIPGQHSFLVMDADTVITGRLFDAVKSLDVQFIVDREELNPGRFNEIYYSLDKISELVPDFKFPGYSFNAGQWLGTSGLISREDFEPYLHWSHPPVTKYPDTFFNGDQGLFNFIIQQKEQNQKIRVQRKEIMIWPSEGKADFIDLEKIRNKTSEQPYIIHWAGMKARTLSGLPRTDILRFYRDYYYSKMPVVTQLMDTLQDNVLYFKKKLEHFIRTRSK